MSKTHTTQRLRCEQGAYKTCSNADCPLPNPLPIEQFHRDRSKRDGHGAMCRSCREFFRMGHWPESLGVVGGSLTLRPHFTGVRGTSHAWSGDENDYLCEMFGLASDEWIGGQVGRTPKGVVARARRMHLHRNDAFLTVKAVAGVLGVGRRTILRYIEVHYLVASPSPGARCGPYRQWRIREESLRLFIRSYPRLCQPRYIDRTLYPDYHALALQGTARLSRKAKPGRRWSKGDDAYLLRHMLHLNTERLAAYFGRNRKAIYHRVGYLRERGAEVPRLREVRTPPPPPARSQAQLQLQQESAA